MIVNLLLTLAYGILSFLTTPINLPDLPQDAIDVINLYLEYITTGIQILNTFVDLQYLLILFSLVILIDVAMLLYRFVLWFIKKIPVINVK